MNRGADMMTAAKAGADLLDLLWQLSAAAAECSDRVKARAVKALQDCYNMPSLRLQVRKNSSAAAVLCAYALCLHVRTIAACTRFATASSTTQAGQALVVVRMALWCKACTV
jgi:hypothetical protein